MGPKRVLPFANPEKSEKKRGQVARQARHSGKKKADRVTLLSRGPKNNWVKGKRKKKEWKGRSNKLRQPHSFHHRGKRKRGTRCSKIAEEERGRKPWEGQLIV